VVLVVLGAGHYLAFRVEVSTPANSLLSIREGVTLLQLGISPYSGSACHVPPLLLWLLAPTASHTHLYALPNILSDVLGALLLRRTAQLLWSAGTRRSIGSVSQGGACKCLTSKGCSMCGSPSPLGSPFSSLAHERSTPPRSCSILAFAS